MQHCSSGSTLLGQAPVWLSCIILFLLGGIVGATGGVVGMVFRHRKMQKAKYCNTESLYGGQYQTAASQVLLLQAATMRQLMSLCCREYNKPQHVVQAQDSQYKSSWRGPPPASHSGLTMAPPSSKAASSLDRQYVNKSPMGQRLLQEDAIRQSGVSGPLGMGVVMQSKCCCGAIPPLKQHPECQCSSLAHTAMI